MSSSETEPFSAAPISSSRRASTSGSSASTEAGSRRSSRCSRRSFPRRRDGSTCKAAPVSCTRSRYLLEVTCTRIVEVENGATVSYDGSYGDYLLAHAERMQALHKAEDRRLRLIVQEAAWASRSPAARSTKQKARLERLERLEATE